MTIEAAGLDLGKLSDYSAFTLVQREGDDIAIVWNRRWPLGTPYARVVSDVCRTLQSPAVAAYRPALVVERNSIGEVVLEAFRARALPGRLVGVMTAPGAGFKRTGPETWSVGKERLLGGLAVLIEQRRLQLSGGSLECAAELKAELLDFQRGFTARGNLKLEARAGRHDDLVMSLALAVWGAGVAEEQA